MRSYGTKYELDRVRTPARRVRDLWAALEDAEERAKAREFTRRRIVSGKAALAEYELLLRPKVTQMLDLFVPTLPVARAQRLGNVPPGVPASRELALARRVLAHQPDEELSEADQARLDELRLRVTEGKREPEARIRAAWALLLIGPKQGLNLRSRLWDSGFAEEESARVLADYEKHHIAVLLADWGPWISYNREIRLEAGFTEQQLEDRKLLMPLRALAEFLEDRPYLD